jgi:hypothetical protein
VANTVLETPLFRVENDVYRWRDVVRLARTRGDWDALAAEANGGLAALRLAKPIPAEVEDAARAFRYAHGLLAADELEAWLERRGLTSADWHGYVERAVTRAACASSPPARQAVADDLVWVEGICSGRLEELARELAQLAAVGTDLAEFRRRAATGEAVAREIELNRLEWNRVAYDVLSLPDADAAAEAALCVRSDGLPLPEVARQAGVEVEARDGLLDEAEPELAPGLLAASPGDLVGPVASGDRFLLAQLRTRTPPSAADESVHARAARAVADRAVSRLVDERVVWLDEP